MSLRETCSRSLYDRQSSFAVILMFYILELQVYYLVKELGNST